MTLVKNEAYWRHVRKLAAQAPPVTDETRDLLRRNGFPGRRAEGRVA